MIYKLNFIFLKIITLKKNSEKIKKFNYHEKQILGERNKTPMLKNNFYSIFNFFGFLLEPNFYFYNFYFQYIYYNKKILKYNKNYLNYFNKSNFVYNASLYNFSVKNNLNFYKSYQYYYLNDFFKNTGKNKFKKIVYKKINFFKFKKNKEFLNPTFLNSPNINKKKNKKFNFFFIKNLQNFNLFFYDNIIFYQNKIKKNDTVSVFFKKLKYENKNKIFDFLFFYKNFYKLFNFNNNLTKNKKHFNFIINEGNLYLNNFLVNNLINLNPIFFSIFKNKIKKPNSNFKSNDKFFFFFNFYKYVNTYTNLCMRITYNICSNHFYNIIKKNKLEDNEINFKKLIFITMKNIIYLNDLYNVNNFFKKSSLISNFFFKNLQILNNFTFSKYSFKNFLNGLKNSLSLNFYNNYYPIFYSSKKTQKLFLSKFKESLNIDYSVFINFYIINFLEGFFKKRIFLKISNNYFNKPSKLNSLRKIYENYKFFQPQYMKKYSLKDFFEIIWYSFFLKDLTLLMEWFCKFMESVDFKNHRRFIILFQNFIQKNQITIFSCFNLKGFFFDIRGKVGVTGNSKKRHQFFSIGRISRSSKIKKINFKQSVVRTPSGVLGVTMIINY